MKVRNSYTATLVSPSKYNPNDFTATGVAVLYIVMLTSLFALPYLFEVVGLSAWLRAMAEKDYFFYMCFSVVVSQAVILLFGVIYSAVKRVNPIQGGGYVCRFDLTQYLFACALIAGIQLCFTPLHMDFTESATSFGVNPIVPNEANGRIGWMILYLVMVPTLPCVCEEIVFRGVIMRGLSRFGGVAAVILSGMMFSIFHGNLQQVVLQFIGGVAIGACVYITKNFTLGCVMHFFNNLFAILVAVNQALSTLSEPLGNVITVCSILSGLALLIVGGHYFLNVYLVEKGYASNSVVFGKAKREVKVLMSCESRAERSSIVIDASQVPEFKRYYPDAMRFKNGRFISLNRQSGSPASAIILLSIGIVLGIAMVVLSQFGL